MFYKYVYIFILLVIFFYIKWKLEKKQSNSQIKEDFFDGITWSNILNNTDFYRNITHLSSNINYNNNYFSIKTSNIGINFIDSNNDNFKIILNPKINNISFQNEYTIGQYSTPKLLEINFNNDLVECKNTRTTYVEDTQFNSDYEYYSIFKLDTSHVSLKPIQQSFTQINNSHTIYIRKNNKLRTLKFINHQTNDLYSLNTDFENFDLMTDIPYLLGSIDWCKSLCNSNYKCGGILVGHQGTALGGMCHMYSKDFAGSEIPFSFADIYYKNSEPT